MKKKSIKSGKKTVGKTATSAKKKTGRSAVSAKASAKTPKVPAKGKTAKKSSSKISAKNVTTEKPATLASFFGQSLEKISEQITNMFSSKPKDIVSAILMDHEGLRNFMGILKDTDREMGERRRAYDQFSALLKSHTLAEEDIVYAKADDLTGRELHIKIAEGYVEHHVADDLMSRIEATSDSLEWSAHANVLSEIVEHHLKEEERDLLPLIRKKAPKALDAEMLTEYLEVRAKTQTKVTEKNQGVLETLK